MITDRLNELENVTDYRLHDIVGIRLIGAGPRDCKTIERQLGPLRGKLEQPPDLVIRFTDPGADAEPLQLLGAGESGFSSNAFYLLQGKHKSSVRVQIPFHQLGSPCEIICESHLAAIPHLLAILNLTAFAKGYLPLHASGIRYRGQGILVAGWAKGGKTETLLGLASKGGEYVGDEWVYLDAAGEHMFGIPEPVRVWSWHASELPDVRRRFGRWKRATLALLGAGAGAVAAAKPLGARSSRHLARVEALLQRQRYVQLPPHQLFAKTAPGLSSRVDRIVFVMSQESPHTTLERIPGDVFAARMAFSLQEERATFLSAYRQFRFAFPDHDNPLIEDLEKTEADRLGRLFAGREVLLLKHPYPASPVALRDCLLSELGGG